MNALPQDQPREKKMLKKVLTILILMTLSACAGASAPDRTGQAVYDTRDGHQSTFSELIPVLLRQRIIIVGEHHTSVAHHRAQLMVIRALKEAGADVAIGLEMFRSDSQQALNRWVSGELSSAAFEKIYYDNWTFPWDYYRMIFDYARERRIPMVGLNVAREVTAQVARKGFGSLSEAQRGKLSNVTCRVDEDYENYIRKAFGAHGHGKMKFTYFCEAQLVWDTIMAVNAIDYLKSNPGAIMVLLCGAGHARKGAVPRQISSRSSMAHVVLLPETADSITIETITAEDADYLIRLEN